MGCCLARYSQAKRHMWGTLDTGYALRKAVLNFFGSSPSSSSSLSSSPPSPDVVKEEDGMVDVVFAGVDKEGGKSTKKSSLCDTENQLNLGTLGILLFRLLEAHIVVGHLLILIIMTAMLIPMSGGSGGMSRFFWSNVTSEHNVHPILLYVLDLCGWLRLFGIVPLVIAIVCYERYHHFIGYERWRLRDADEAVAVVVQEQDEEEKEWSAIVGASVSSSTTTTTSATTMRKVQELGLRSQLVSTRTWWNLLDWLMIPFAGIIFQTAPQAVAHVSQLWTDRLDYTVAAKPTLKALETVSSVSVSKSVVVSVSGDGVFAAAATASEATTTLTSANMVETEQANEVVVQMYGEITDPRMHRIDGGYNASIDVAAKAAEMLEYTCAQDRHCRPDSHLQPQPAQQLLHQFLQHPISVSESPSSTALTSQQMHHSNKFLPTSHQLQTTSYYNHQVQEAQRHHYRHQIMHHLEQLPLPPAPSSGVIFSEGGKDRGGGRVGAEIVAGGAGSGVGGLSPYGRKSTFTATGAVSAAHSSGSPGKHGLGGDSGFYDFVAAEATASMDATTAN